MRWKVTYRTLADRRKIVAEAIGENEGEARADFRRRAPAFYLVLSIDAIETPWLAEGRAA